MKKYLPHCHSAKLFLALTAILFISVISVSAAPAEYYELRIFHLSSKAQEAGMDQYLKEALLPALKRSGLRPTGVFKPLTNDTAAHPKIYLLISYTSLSQPEEINLKLEKDPVYQAAAREYIQAPHNQPPYQRIEKIILKAFSSMPQFKVPDFNTARPERIYELRSYESATEHLHSAKVHMFNEGGEAALFERLGFNAIFYGQVLAGSSMPNLMYMTSFENRPSRDAHWKTFSEDPAWKKLSAEEKYRNTVSRITVIFMYPAAYSDY